MQQLRLEDAAVQGTLKSNGKVCSFSTFFSLIAFALIFTLFGPQKLSAQASEVYWFDQGDYQIGYQLSTSVSTLSANEQFSVNLYLEALAPFDAMGGMFEITHSEDISPETNPLSLPSTSWLGSVAEMESAEFENVNAHSVTYGVQRSDETLSSGSGWVLTADFVVGNLSVEASDVVQSIGGNLIMDDNWDMRPVNTSPFRLNSSSVAPLSPVSTTETQITVFPNPFTEWVKVETASPQTLVASIFDLKGELLYQTTPNADGRIDLGGLPQGLHLLVIRNQAGELLHHTRIVKK